MLKAKEMKIMETLDMCKEYRESQTVNNCKCDYFPLTFKRNTIYSKNVELA